MLLPYAYLMLDVRRQQDGPAWRHVFLGRGAAAGSGWVGAWATLKAMRPSSLGRALGIGARLASKRILPPAPPPPTRAQQREQQEQARARSKQRVAAAEQLGRKTRVVGQEGRRFGAALWNPFAHASSILWLEVTGMFFALFAILFAQHAWALRGAWRGAGPRGWSGAGNSAAAQSGDHAHFLLYCVLSGLFLYFAASSFLRAAARSRRRRREG